MARVLRVSPRYLSDAKALAPARSRASRDVSRVLLALEDAAELPAHGDALKILPLSGRDGGQVQVLAYGRRIQGRDLVIWYRVTSTEVSLEALTRGL